MFLLEPFIEFILSTTIQEAWKRRAAILDRIRTNTEKISNWQRYFVPKRSLINREREVGEILSAINEKATFRIILLTGKGGVGKTRILEEVIRQAKQKRKRYIRYSGILDMYHTDLRSLLSLQDALIKNLDHKGKHFLNYRSQRERFEDRRYKGISGKTLEDERNALKQVFLEDYSAFAQKYRSVLVFDTAENLSPEPDLIQSIFRINNSQLAVRDWLLNEVSKLPNTVIVVASRPHEVPESDIPHEFPESGFSHDLAQKYSSSPGQLQRLRLEGLTRVECQHFLMPWANNSNLAILSLVNQSDWLWEKTKGNPVELSVYVKLGKKHQSLIESIVSASDAQQRTIADLSHHNFWRESLVDSLFQYESDEPEQRIFYLLAITRRGLTADLLHYLEPAWTLEECQAYLEKVKNDSIVKVRESTTTLFLHDALYELFDLYKRSKVSLDPWYQRLTNYYQSKQARTSYDRKSWGESAVNILFYELHRNPRNAYEEYYLQWDDVTIRGREAEIEIQLRDEFLRFFNSPFNQQKLEDQGLTARIIEQESAIRWIKYYVDTSNYSRAIELAESVIAVIPELSNMLSSITKATYQSSLMNEEQQQRVQAVFEHITPFIKAQLLAYYGDAQAFVGGDENQSVAILHQAITLLKTVTFAESEPLAWLHKRVLGRVYNALGYSSQAQGRYGRAENYYKIALSHYTPLQGIDDERGNTLNNLAYLLAVLGDLDMAKKYAKDAFLMRQKLGQAYPIGLSYNTRGLIYALNGELDLGYKECILAWEEFHKIEDARGMGLAYNALGYIHRLMAEQTGSNSHVLQAGVIELYQQAEENFLLAVDIFQHEINEPVRLWEAYNELGSLYCDWGLLLQRCGVQQEASERREQARDHLLLALQVAQQHKLQFQEADTYDDLAEVAADQENFEDAENWIKRCLTLIPEAYRQQAGIEHLQENETGEFYWLILGKVHFQQGKWAFLTQLELDRGLVHFGEAIKCFRKFWHTPHYLQSKVKIMAQYIQRAGMPTARLKEKLQEISIQCGIDRTSLIDAILHGKGKKE